MYKDVYTGVGPLAGIHSGLLKLIYRKELHYIMRYSFNDKGVIKFLTDYPAAKPVVIAKADNYIQQLCGVYNKTVLPLAEEILMQNIITDERNSDQKRRGCRVLELVKLADAEIIDIEKEYKEYIPGTFHNMNNPSEYEHLLRKLK